MKSIITSFSMDLHEAQVIHAATRGVKNRSAWIVDACLKKARGEDEFSVADIPTKQLMASLMNREETPKHLKTLLLDALNQK